MTTFKVGDRVRCGRSVGVIDDIDDTDGWVRFGGTDTFGEWTKWVDPIQCTPAPPMSPEAKMLWHAMRAGAKRTPGRVFALGKRKREYVLLAEGSKFEILLAVYGEVPERGDR